MGNPARYIMVGGFLGAGKTTTLIRLAEKLQAEGKSRLTNFYHLLKNLQKLVGAGSILQQTLSMF